MGMFDTYSPCEKLQNVVVKEIGITNFDWQTKAWLSHLAYFGINEDLRLTLDSEGCYDSASKDEDVQRMINGTFTEVDEPWVDHGVLYLDFKDSVLQNILYLNMGVEVLIKFKAIDDYEVVKHNVADINLKKRIVKDSY